MIPSADLQKLRDKGIPIPPGDVDPERAVVVMVLYYEEQEIWSDKDDNYWLQRLMGEFGELAGTLSGDHEDPTNLELVQIASIAINWLNHRNSRRAK